MKNKYGFHFQMAESNKAILFIYTIQGVYPTLEILY